MIFDGEFDVEFKYDWLAYDPLGPHQKYITPSEATYDATTGHLTVPTKYRRLDGELGDFNE